MKKNHKNRDVSALMSLLKVFHVNYASEEDCRSLGGLNPNDPNDVVKAVNILLIPDIATYPLNSRISLLELLRKALANPEEDFGELFEELGSVFDDEIINPRAFMTAILNALEADHN